jgi:hypothetical protein
MSGGGWRMAVAACALAGGCATLAPSPELSYRDALDTALTSRACAPAKVAAVFAAYDTWFRTIPATRRDEAAGLLLTQAEAFRTLGCDDAARASLETVLRRYPGEADAEVRHEALRGLQTLPPPYPLSRTPVRGT